jgi:hypothetical protein
MASGKTEEMLLFDRSLQWYPKQEKPVKERNRLLTGKARIRARKAAQRAK